MQRGNWNTGQGGKEDISEGGDGTNTTQSNCVVLRIRGKTLFLQRFSFFLK
uniref:Uncharacterized protein n=1 Tax=Geobacillus sp. (strain WCH70) TaxID=471223 RepID=C5DB38_GEOSW